MAPLMHHLISESKDLFNIMMIELYTLFFAGERYNSSLIHTFLRFPLLSLLSKADGPENAVITRNPQEMFSRAATNLLEK